MAEIKPKTVMFIDYQKQAEGIEFSFLRMDLQDVEIFYEALKWLIELKEGNKQDPPDPDYIERLKSIQREFQVNHYTQNTRKQLVKYNSTNNKKITL